MPQLKLFLQTTTKLSFFFYVAPVSFRPDNGRKFIAAVGIGAHFQRRRTTRRRD